MNEIYERAEQLREFHGVWGEHQDYPVSDWQVETENDYTRKGYWEWVASKLIEAEEQAAREKRLAEEASASRPEPLTQEVYVARLGNVCPFCQSPSITGHSIEVDGAEAKQEVTCHDCGSAWLDVYELKGYEVLP